MNTKYITLAVLAFSAGIWYGRNVSTQRRIEYFITTDVASDQCRRVVRERGGQLVMGECRPCDELIRDGLMFHEATRKERAAKCDLLAVGGTP